MNKHLALACLLLLPLPALAAPKCEFSKPVDMALDLAGVTKVMFEVNSHDLRLNAAPNAAGALGGRACASTAELLNQLVVTQQKSGDTLRVALRRESSGVKFQLGQFYTAIEVTGTVPDNVLVQLNVGSGDAVLDGAINASADVGSGDVALSNIRGRATLAVGSGDISLTNIGALKVLSIGSGDVVGRDIRGAVEIGSIGSGDLTLVGIGGPVQLDSVGSGDATFRNVRGDVTVGSVGSGDITVQNGQGNVSVARIGSGDLNTSGIKGAVSLPRKH